ncbi:MAG TPA: phenylalanine--tRNA ligase subunit alpha, partial [Ignavibacteriaceae bacterium]
MLDKNITEIKESFYSDIKSVSSIQDVEEIRIKYFSRNGLVSKLFEDLKDVVKEEKPILGKKLNLLRNEVSTYFEEVKERISSTQSSKENEIDLTLPGKEYIIGSKHILTQTLDEIKSIFKGLGFSVANGPELESDYYNFESLNFPADHPARDMQDTFFVSKDFLLRT